MLNWSGVFEYEDKCLNCQVCTLSEHQVQMPTSVHILRYQLNDVPLSMRLAPKVLFFACLQMLMGGVGSQSAASTLSKFPKPHRFGWLLDMALSNFDAGQSLKANMCAVLGGLVQHFIISPGACGGASQQLACLFTNLCIDQTAHWFCCILWLNQGHDPLIL